MMNGERAALGASVPGTTMRPVKQTVLPFDAKKLVVDDVPSTLAVFQVFAAPWKVEPAQKVK